nr:immunoglobulin light chain junction region [Macaca mulatta]
CQQHDNRPQLTF